MTRPPFDDPSVFSTPAYMYREQEVEEHSEVSAACTRNEKIGNVVSYRPFPWLGAGAGEGCCLWSSCLLLGLSSVCLTFSFDFCLLVLFTGLLACVFLLACLRVCVRVCVRACLFLLACLVSRAQFCRLLALRKASGFCPQCAPDGISEAVQQTYYYLIYSRPHQQRSV